MQTVCDRVPFGSVRDRLHHNQVRAQFIALMKFRVERAGVSFGIMRNQAHAAQSLRLGNSAVRDNMAVARGDTRRGNDFP